MQILLTRNDLERAIGDYADQIIAHSYEDPIEIVLPEDLPTVITIGSVTANTTTEKVTAKKTPAKSKSKTKTKKAPAVDLNDPKLADDTEVEVPESSEETANVVAEMEGKTDKKAPTKKRMFGQ